MFASQAYGSFARWYVTNLKAKPYLINAGSGLILMSAGDVIAQKVQIGGNERHQVVVDESERLLLKRQKRQRIKTEDQQQQCHNNNNNNGTDTTTTTESAFQQLFLHGATTTATTSTIITDVVANVVATSSYYKKYLKDECSFWDKSRTAKMAVWSVLFTPFYVGIYKTYDRYLPKRTPASIVARVGLSFLASVPINFAFYTYGNFVQHTADWYTEQQKQQQPAKVVVVPYRFDQLVEKTKRKLDAELFNTIKTSATFWIPINFLSFSIVPAHIQPLSLMFFSVFWNCYLSMSQHREVKVTTAAADILPSSLLSSSSSSSSSSLLLCTAQVIATSTTTTQQQTSPDSTATIEK